MFRLLLVCSLSVVSGQWSLAGERVPFSMLDAPPVITQGRERPSFSIHAQEDAPVATSQRIAFSVHDAKVATDPQPEGDAPKANCAPIREVNRVLVIYHEKPATETVREYVCNAQFCGWQNRTWTRSPKESEKFLKSLKALPDAWNIGVDDCCHFKPINADDPKHAKLVKELKITFGEMPLLVKESEPDKRKRAAGMDGPAAAHIYLKWYVRAEPEASSGATRCEPMGPLDGIQFAAEQWTYPGNIRHHLTDPKFPHHLPAALVDSWSDAQCVGWHNWHHGVLRGEGRGARGTQPVRRTSLAPHPSRLTQRIADVARSTLRSPPAQMVAAANASYGNSSDAKRAKKKRSMRYGNGVKRNGGVSARWSLVRFSPSNKSVCSTRSHC